MKKLKLILALIMVTLLSNPIQAQPDLTDVGTFFGFYYAKVKYYLNTSTINPNPVPPGNGVTWDFSALPKDTNNTVSVQGMGSSPYTFYFPSATHIYQIGYSQSGDVIYEYYFYKPSQYNYYEYQGNYLVGGGEYKYDNGKKEFIFPMKFNVPIIDPYSVSSGSGKRTLTYDGFGKLKLPNYTKDSVFRVHYRDSISPTINSDKYVWMTTGYKYMIMTIKSDGTRETWYSNITTPSTGITELQTENTINIYPNPAKDKLKIYCSGFLNNKPISASVFDINGRVLYTDNAYKWNEDLDISKLSPGIYFVNIISDDINVKKRFVVD